MLNLIDHLLIVLSLSRKTTVPTPIDYSLATLFVLIGGVILWHFPEFTVMGASLICLGIFSHIFPGPLARQKLQLTAQQRANLRDKVIAQRRDKIVWWASPLPMIIVVMVIVIYETVT
jgi:hypothetical protein